MARARALVGCRFRPQGRSPELGVDCIGVACVAFEIPADEVPCDYRLRGNFRDRIERELGGCLTRVAEGDVRPGDLMLLAVATDQVHLAVKTNVGFVHADAGLRKVAEVPGSPPWPMIAAYRMLKE